MKILIVKTSSLGDIIQAFPVVQYLKQRYPTAKIDWVVEKPFAELIEAHPDINHVWKIQSKQWRKSLYKRETRQEIHAFIRKLRCHQYDLVFDLQGNIKSGLITGCSRSSRKIGFGSSTVPEWPNLLFTNRRYNPSKHENIRENYLHLVRAACGDISIEPTQVLLNISAEEKRKVQSILSHSSLSNGPKILVCCGSNWPNKQMSTSSLKKFLTLVQSQFKGRFLFAWGMPSEKLIAEELQVHFSDHSIVIDKLSLVMLQNLMASVDGVFAMDSLPLHLAGTTTTPTFSVFGASLAHKYKPLGMQHKAYQGQCPYNKTFDKRCPILRTCSSGSCIKDIDTNDLFQHFIDWMNSQKNSQIH